MGSDDGSWWWLLWLCWFSYGKGSGNEVEAWMERGAIGRVKVGTPSGHTDFKLREWGHGGERKIIV